MKIIVPITKVDEIKREVWGCMAVEQRDQSKEILDYASSKPHFQAWSDGFATATDGKSLGNVRSMHGKIAAGKVISFRPDDDSKAFLIGTNIVDNNEWEKCVAGVYTGFSIGGDYEKRWDDPDLKGVKRYTARPTEVSLVDNPCIPGATFEAIKADGSHEIRKFQPEAEPVRKGLYAVSQLAALLASLDLLRQDAKFEAEYEKDGSDIPDRMKSLVQTASKLLVDMAKEESSELTQEADAPKEAFEMAKVVGELKKALALLQAVSKTAEPDLSKKMEPHLKEIGKHVDKIASAHADMGKSIVALQGGEDADDLPNDDAEDKGKGADKEEQGKKAAEASFTKANSRLDLIETAQAETNGNILKVAESIDLLTKAFLGQPAPSKAALNAKGVSKAEDQADLTKQKPAGEKETPLELMKRIQSAPPTRVVIGR